MCRLLMALVLVGLSTAPAIAESRPRSLTLHEAIARVQSDGFDLRLARADAAMAAADARNSAAVLRPQLGLSATSLDANEAQLGMPIARQAYGSAALSLTIFTPSGNANARAASETSRAAQSAVATATDDAVFAVSVAYRRVQLTDAVVQSRAVTVSDLARHLIVRQERVALGKSAKYQMLRDRSALATAQQAEEDARSERDQAASDLAVLLDLKQEPLAVEALVPSVLEGTRDALLARALRSRPSVLAAQERVEAARALLAAARAAYSPTAVLTAQTYNGSSAPALGRSGGQVQVTASLPIVDGGSRSALTARSNAQLDRAIAVRDRTLAEVARDVANAFREYEAASRNLSSANAAVVDAQEQLRLARLREAAGKATDVEVFDAESLAAIARESTARSLARYDLAIASIYHSVGGNLP